jgi:hypothetical protein
MVLYSATDILKHKQETPRTTAGSAVCVSSENWEPAVSVLKNVQKRHNDSIRLHTQCATQFISVSTRVAAVLHVRHYISEQRQDLLHLGQLDHAHAAAAVIVRQHLCSPAVCQKLCGLFCSMNMLAFARRKLVARGTVEGVACLHRL